MSYITGGSVNIGARPGTLRRKPGDGEVQVRLMDFALDAVTEQQFTRVEDCLEWASSTNITWVHIKGRPDAAALRALQNAYKLHSLAVEDVQSAGQRPKLEPYEKQLFQIMVRPMLDDVGLRFEQVSFFYGDGYVVSFHDGADDIFAPLVKRIHDGKGRIRKGGADYLLYCLNDIVVDHGFPLLEIYASRLDELEEAVFANPEANHIQDIHRAKRELILMRRVLWHQRVMLDELLRSDEVAIDPANLAYFRDCHDHSQRVMDLLETQRDMAASLMDTWLSLSSHRMNDVMRVLTIISTIFIPLSFIVGLYGMNFETEGKPWNMPELRFRYGYFLLLGVMLSLVSGMLYLFRRRGWL